MNHFKIQPASAIDHLLPDGTELTRRPHPIVCDEGGVVRGHLLIGRVIGFVSDLARHEVDVSWREVAARHVEWSSVPGMYAITADHEGRWATQVCAVETFERL